MNIRKNTGIYKILFTSLILCTVLAACSPPFIRDPRLYNSSRNTKNEGPVLPGAEPDLGDNNSGNDPFDTYKDPDEGGFPAETFDNWQLRATFSSSNVPSYSFTPGGWYSGDAAKNEYIYDGGSSSAGSNSISGVKYYLYKGKNNLYDPSSAYNTVLQATEAGNPKLSRFYFYRFTGKGGGLVALDNCLMAVDTYSKLIFAYGKPIASYSAMGQQVPTAWGAFESYSSGPGGVRYKFYEYDPVGAVNEKGEVELFQWFKDQMGNGNYEPKMAGHSSVAAWGSPGKSPYAPGEETLPPVSGTLTITLDSFENVNFYDTGSWGDHGEADNSEWPEFLYNIRARVYAGMNEAVFERLAAYGGSSFYDALKEKVKTGTPAAAQYIQVGTKADLTKTDSSAANRTLTYEFENCTKNMYAELDSRIMQINIKDDDWISEYGNPLFTMKYDRDSETWELADNGLYTFDGQAVAYYTQDETGLTPGFTLGAGERRILKIDIGADTKGSKMALTYTLSWGTPSVPPPPEFPENVKNASYSRRDGLDLHSWEFSADGMTASKYKTEWRKTRDLTDTKTWQSENGKTDAVYSGSSFTLTQDLSQLTVDGKTYVLNFADPGPEFLERVKSNPVFSGGASYEFRDEGRTLIVDGDTYTFARPDNDDNYRNRGVYTKKIVLTPWYYGIEFSNDDNTIKMTRASSNATIQWNTLDWEATRQ